MGSSVAIRLVISPNASKSSMLLCAAVSLQCNPAPLHTSSQLWPTWPYFQLSFVDTDVKGGAGAKGGGGEFTTKKPGGGGDGGEDGGGLGHSQTTRNCCAGLVKSHVSTRVFTHAAS